MQILNISVNNRPAKTRTSWVYPLYSQEVICTRQYVQDAVLAVAPMTLDVLYSVPVSFSSTLADTVTYTDLSGGHEIVQTRLPSIVSASLQDTVVYSKLNPTHETLYPDISFGSMGLRDVLVSISMPIDTLYSTVNNFEMVLGE